MINCEDTSTTLMTSGEDTSTTTYYLVTTFYDIPNNQCDNIDNLGHLTDYEQVTKRATRWQQRWLMTVSDGVVNLSDKRFDYYLLHLSTQVMTKIQHWQPWRHWVNTVDNPCDDLVPPSQFFRQHLMTTSGSCSTMLLSIISPFPIIISNSICFHAHATKFEWMLWCFQHVC